MEDIKKIFKSVVELSIKRVSKTIENEAKTQKGGFLSMLWVTLGTRLLWNLLRNKCVIRAWWRNNVIKTGFLIPPHSAANFERWRYYQKQPKFNSADSSNNLLK